MAVQEDKRRLGAAGPRTVNIAVVRLPAISNFTDMEALAGEPDTVVNYLFSPAELTEDYDCLILPGTKNTVEDAASYDEFVSERDRMRGLQIAAIGGFATTGLLGGIGIFLLVADEDEAGTLLKISMDSEAAVVSLEGRF